MTQVPVPTELRPSANAGVRLPALAAQVGAVPAVGGEVPDLEVTGVTLRDTVTGEQSNLALDGVFVAIGNDPRTHLVHGQLELTPAGTIAVEGRSSKTNLPGVFAAGDVIDPTYRQAVTAAASGTVAALDAEHYLAALDQAEHETLALAN